jgi:hypothetical protein
MPPWYPGALQGCVRWPPLRRGAIHVPSPSHRLHRRREDVDGVAFRHDELRLRRVDFDLPEQAQDLHIDRLVGDLEAPRIARRPTDFSGGVAPYALDLVNAERLWDVALKLIDR